MNTIPNTSKISGVARRTCFLGLLTLACLSSNGAGTAPFRYKFEMGKDYSYEVKIVATLPEEIETRHGTTTITAKTVSDQEFTLRHAGNLTTSRQSTASPTPFNRPHFSGFPWGDQIFPHPGDSTVSALGRVIKTQAGTPLPYLLGNLEFLALEEFPADARSRWQTKREVVIQEREQSRFPRPFGRSPDDGVKRSAQETLDYSVRQTTGDLVHIGKQERLRSDEQVDGNPTLQMSGEGELVFDRKQGVVQSHTMKYTLTVTEKGVTVKVPVAVECRLMTSEELTKLRETTAAATAVAQQAAAKANEPKALQAGEREKLMRDLKSSNEWTVRAAADRLAKAPAEGNAEEVAALLTALLSDRNNFTKAAAAKALVNWATANSSGALRTAVEDTDLWTRKAAMETLGRFPSPENAQAVAARLVELSDRGDAVKALEAMGPAAEPAVLTYLKDRDNWVRLEACKVLGQIGTPSSIPAIEAFGAKGQGFDGSESEKAIKAIRARSGGGK